MTDVALPVGAQPGGPPAAADRPDFEIVPRKGLTLVAIAFVPCSPRSRRTSSGRWSSCTSPAARRWTVIDLFFGLVIGPILGKMSPPARVEFSTRLMPKMLLIMPTVVTITLAGGWQLGHLTGTDRQLLRAHGWIVASYIVVGVMAVIALGLLEPANVAVLFELKKRRPNPW